MFENECYMPIFSFETMEHVFVLPKLINKSLGIFHDKKKQKKTLSTFNHQPLINQKIQ